MDQRRLKELALKGLMAEVAELQAQLQVNTPVSQEKPRTTRRKMSAAERKAHSERMKAIWASRKKASKKA
jgi:hypothetical protein